MPALSPLAPATSPALRALAGVRLASTNCGIRYKNRPDLLLAELAPGTQVAGVFTRSLCPSAPVDWCRMHLAQGEGRLLIVNSGNANAFTGKAGIEAVNQVAKAAAMAANCPEHAIFMASTGVIGEPLPASKITDVLPALRAQLNEDAWDDAAAAIMTTDTFKKTATRDTEIAGVPVTIHGIAKGSGMIAPDMATMLAFLFTDAALPAPVLQALLSEANAKSFNAITVDSDTSTSDTALMFATGRGAKHPAVTSLDDPQLQAFRAALHSLMIELAQLIVRDGEGASKFIQVRITGAESDAAAQRIALSIANSPLVKTAIAGEDANWGRIVMAVGKAGERAERDLLKIHIGGILVAEQGMVSPDYKEAEIMPHMKGETIDILVDIGLGNGNATVWTCDLTHGYIDINGSYRS